MLKFVNVCLALGLILFPALFLSNEVQAVDKACTDYGITLTPDKVVYGSGQKISVTVKVDKSSSGYQYFDESQNYDLAFLENGTENLLTQVGDQANFPGNNLPDTITVNSGLKNPSSYNLVLRTRTGVTTNQFCAGPTITVAPVAFTQASCKMTIPPNIKINTPQTIAIDVNPKDDSNIIYLFYVFRDQIDPSKFGPSQTRWWEANLVHQTYIPLEDPKITSLNLSPMPPNRYTAAIIAYSQGLYWGCAINNFTVTNSDTSTDTTSSQAAPGAGAASTQQQNSQGSIDNSPKPKGAGQPCDNNKGIQTAIGCIHTDPTAFIKDLLTIISGIAGGIAFLLMVYGAFEMITSSGNPQTLKNGQDRFVSAVVGLLFVVFSVLLLQIIGVNILNIPGFK